MVKCRKVLEELETFRKGDASCELRNEITLHLESCANCRKELASLRKLDELIGVYQAAPLSADFKSKLHDRMAQDEARAGESSYRFSINWRKVGVLASAAVVLITVAVWLLNPFGVNNPAPVTNHETEIVNNLDLLENMDSAEVVDLMTDYELVQSFPEVMDVELYSH